MLQAFDFLAAAADDDPRPGRVDEDPDLRADALDDHFGNPGVGVLFLDFPFHPQVFMDETGVFGTLGEPAGTPLLIEPQPEAVWMRFLSHGLPPCPFFEVDVHVARLFLDPVSPALRGGTDPFPGRPLVDDDLADDQLVDIEPGVFLLGVGDRRPERLFQDQGGLGLGVEPEDGQGLPTGRFRMRSATSRAF